jgi:hypothetical protein
MTLCPIALAAGCKKCPVVKLCPLKTLLGNFEPGQPNAPKPDGSDAQPKDD